MGRPRCDPFDAAAIIAAIGKGETTPLRAYQDYAATAARPYARASFETFLQRHQRLGPSPEPGPAVPPAPHAIDAAADAESDAFWGARLAVKSRVVTTEADNASLTVKGGSLFVHDGERRLRYDAGARMPAAIVMAGWGGFVSVEALRFCASHRIAIVVLDWMRDLLTVMPGAPRAAAAMLRAQALADPAWIASRVVMAKIENAVRAGALARDEAMRFIDAAAARRDRARGDDRRGASGPRFMGRLSAQASMAGRLAPRASGMEGTHACPPARRPSREAVRDASHKRHAQRRLFRHRRTARRRSVKRPARIPPSASCTPTSPAAGLSHGMRSSR